MADNSTTVKDLTVACVSDPESGVSAKGTKYLRFRGVHEDGDDKTWFKCVAFGPVSDGLKSMLQKGTKMKVMNGKASQKEYVNKEGKPGTENNLIINSAKVATKSGVVTVDEFYSA